METYYEAAMHLLDNGCFVTIKFTETSIRMRWMEERTLKAKGWFNPLVCDDDERRIAHMLAYAHELNEA